MHSPLYPVNDALKMVLDDEKFRDYVKQEAALWPDAWNLVEDWEDPDVEVHGLTAQEMEEVLTLAQLWELEESGAR